MDVDNHATDSSQSYPTWWGGADYAGYEDIPWCQEGEEWYEETEADISQMQSQWGKGFKRKM